MDNPEELLNLARQNGIRTAPLDIHSLFSLMNITIVYSDSLDNDTSGCLKNTPDGWVCTVNAKHHPTRQRFTLAHELAHYILHRNDQSEFVDHTYFRSSDGQNVMEFEANAFAATLLMPESDMKYFIQNVSSKVEEVARRFDVSPLAVRVRARQLGLKETS